MKMRGAQKKEEIKEEEKIDRPLRARRIVHGSSRDAPGNTQVSNQEEINRIYKISLVPRLSNEQNQVNEEGVLEILGINQNSDPVDKQTTGEEGKGERKQTPGEVDEEFKSTMPISKEGTKMKTLKDIFEPSEDDNDDDVSSQEGYSKSKRPNKGPRKHQLVNSLRRILKIIQERKKTNK
jgi:hypothetical protein